MKKGENEKESPSIFKVNQKANAECMIDVSDRLGGGQIRQFSPPSTKSRGSKEKNRSQRKPHITSLDLRPCQRLEKSGMDVIF